MAVNEGRSAETPPPPRPARGKGPVDGRSPVAQTEASAPASSPSAAPHPPTRPPPVPGTSGTDSGVTVVRGEPAVAERCGPYEILGELGAGGMGVVYRARHVALDKPVALKVIRVGPGTPQESLERFQREARMVASLRHPGIVAVHDYGVEGDAHWFAMDLLHGRTLEEWLGEAPPLADKVTVVERVCRAVQYAHSKGVLHRDLKPANVMVDECLSPVVLDFGLAKQLTGAAQGGGLTQAGSGFGTPHYMAPEQAGGFTGLIGVPTDVYALGALMYYAVTGRPPHEGENVSEVLVRIVREEPPPPSAIVPGVPAALEAAVLKAMAHEPGARYASAEAFADDLGRFVAGKPMQAQPPSPLQRLGGSLKRRRFALAAAFLVAVVGVVAWAAYPRDRAASANLRPENRAPAIGPGSEPTALVPSEPDPDAPLEVVVQEGSPGGEARLRSLQRHLEDLASLPPKDLRKWITRLQEGAPRAQGVELRSALDDLLRRARAELDGRQAPLRDLAVKEAGALTADGDAWRALDRLDRFLDEYPRLADDPALVAARRAARELGDRAAAALDQELDQVAAEGRVGERRQELERAIARLPADLKARTLERLKVLEREEREAATTTSPAAGTPEEDEGARLARVIASADEVIGYRWIEEAQRRVAEALATGSWPTQRGRLAALEDVFNKMSKVQAAAVALLRSAPKEALELEFDETDGPKWQTLKVLGLDEDAMAVRFEGAPSRPFNELSALCVTNLARRQLGSEDAVPEDVALLLTFAYHIDYSAGKRLRDESLVAPDVAIWIRDQTAVYCHGQVKSLSEALEARRVEDCRWMVGEIDSLAPELDDVEQETVEAARRLVDEADAANK